MCKFLYLEKGSLTFKGWVVRVTYLYSTLSPKAVSIINGFLFFGVFFGLGKFVGCYSLPTVGILLCPCRVER